MKSGRGAFYQGKKDTQKKKELSIVLIIIFRNVKETHLQLNARPDNIPAITHVDLWKWMIWNELWGHFVTSCE